MKISEILKENKVTLSMEVFPPKTEPRFDAVSSAVKEISKLKPAFISCTYGAGGGTSKYTVQISKDIMDYGVTSMAHLTCVSSSHETVRQQILNIKEAGIENILALRGDIPDGMAFPGTNQFEHAIDLIHVIKEEYPEACIGGACYPEKHPDAPDKDTDIKHIKEKVDAGCEFLTTQMFFDNSIYFNYLYRLREAGVNVPVIAGIMPVTTKTQMERSIELSGCIIPPRFKAMVDAFGDSPEKMKQVGVIYATEQIVELISNGCTHIHVYTMNKPEIAASIMEQISTLI
ncbi:MAG: methylenetetrahydrofolate reductase [NAD(P)H] [Lachnospiraceae bacterium]|nr:methylenetetrahydrofolate reductase [NAD(P)H] [Lachnospiraceae bacterium]